MRFGKIIRLIQPYLSAMAAVFVVTLLVAAIYFTEVDKQWTVFLSGVLIASILGLASRSSRAEWNNTRNTTQLTLLKEKLTQEELMNNRTTHEHKKCGVSSLIR